MIAPMTAAADDTRAGLTPPAFGAARADNTTPARERTPAAGREPTPHEVLVRGVLVHRWAERDGTYAELVQRRSQSLSTLPGR